MKAALGSTFIVNFIVIFTVVFISLFVGSISYTKALRIKNRITDIIEENNGYDSNAISEIGLYLSDAGYRISAPNKNNCKINGKTASEYNATLKYPDSNNLAQNYDYCIFEFTTKKGTYYGVKTYMYLDLPLIGDKVKIGVYGETKVLGLLRS